MPQLVGSNSQSRLFHQVQREEEHDSAQNSATRQARLIDQVLDDVFSPEKNFSKSPQGGLRTSQKDDGGGMYPSQQYREMNNNSVLSATSSSHLNPGAHGGDPRLSDMLHLPTPYSRNPGQQRASSNFTQPGLSPNALAAKKQQTLSSAGRHSNHELE
jgi:hypothetical protein